MSSVTFPASQRELREAMCRVGRSLFERGRVHSTAGNLSVRLPQDSGYLITPTDACLGFLAPERLAWVDADGRQLAGDRASKTLALHRHIYAHSNAGCVLHTHSTHLVALTLSGVWQTEAVLPPITPYQVMKVGPIPLMPYLRPGDSRMAQAVQTLLTQRPGLRGVLHERLGPTVWADTPDAAMALLDELEETARLWLMTDPRPAPLSPAQLQDLAESFGAHW